MNRETSDEQECAVCCPLVWSRNCFVSFMRAGEAKLRERVRDDAPQAKGANGGKSFASNHSSFID